MFVFNSVTGQPAALQRTQTQATALSTVISVLQLIVFALCTVVNSFVWFEFAPRRSLIANAFGVSSEYVDFLSLLYFVAVLPCFLHSSMLYQRYGLRFGLLIGAALTSVGCWLLVLGLSQTMWNCMVIGQALNAAGHTLLVIAPSRLASVWFTEHRDSSDGRHRSLACGTLVAAQAIGVLASEIVVPFCVGQSISQLLFFAQVVACTATFMWFVSFLLFRSDPPSVAASSIIQYRRSNSLRHDIEHGSDFYSVLSSCCYVSQDTLFLWLLLASGFMTAAWRNLCYYYLSIFEASFGKFFSMDFLRHLSWAVLSFTCLGALVGGWLLDRRRRTPRLGCVFASSSAIGAGIMSATLLAMSELQHRHMDDDVVTLLLVVATFGACMSAHFASAFAVFCLEFAHYHQLDRARLAAADNDEQESVNHEGAITMQPVYVVSETMTACILVCSDAIFSLALMQLCERTEITRLHVSFIVTGVSIVGACFLLCTRIACSSSNSININNLVHQPEIEPEWTTAPGSHRFGFVALPSDETSTAVNNTRFWRNTKHEEEEYLPRPSKSDNRPNLLQQQSSVM